MMKDDRRFSAREARAVLWLLPVLAVAGWLVWVATATADFSYAETGNDAEEPSLRGAESDEVIQPRHSESFRTDSPRNDGADGEGEMVDVPTQQLFTFDPNTVEYHDLVRLGFSRGEALGIIKYRERGKVFEIAEDFAACYQVSEAMYRRLEPWIRIGEEFRLKPFESRSADSRASLRGAGSDEAIRSAEAELLRTESPRNDGPGEVSFSGSERLPVDLNTADSAALIAVSGIGPGTVGRILEYRARLGGFADVEQLAEVSGVTEQNYLRIVEQIYVDPAEIQKIDINFAPAKSLASHPYFRAAALRKLLKERQLKGGWRSITELETDNIFTAGELDRLGPYLIFN